MLQVTVRQGLETSEAEDTDDEDAMTEESDQSVAEGQHAQGT